MISLAKTYVVALVLSTLTCSFPAAEAEVYTVSPGGFQAALDKVSPGDTIQLSAGDYFETVATKIDGEPDKYITIEGESDEAVVRGNKNGGSNRVFSVKHSYYHLNKFTVDGQLDDEYYFDKCIYVHDQENQPSEIHFNGHSFRSSINGMVISNMNIRNCGDECLRMRYFITYSQVYNNIIENCGVNDFVLHPNDGGKNGEGLYLGTSSNQWDDGNNPTSEPDESRFNHIFKNHFDTEGNEGVDIKEGSSNNIVEDNYCTGQKDPNSACLDSRGSSNIFRYNTAENNIGAAIRFGGHTIDGYTYGVDNEAYENLMINNDKGGVSLMVGPQGAICQNDINGASPEVVGSVTEDVIPSESCGVATSTSTTLTTPNVTKLASDVSSSQNVGGVSSSKGMTDDSRANTEKSHPDIDMEGVDRAVDEKRESLPMYDHLHESDFETPSI